MVRRWKTWTHIKHILRHEKLNLHLRELIFSYATVGIVDTRDTYLAGTTPHIEYLLEDVHSFQLSQATFSDVDLMGLPACLGNLGVLTQNFSSSKTITAPLLPDHVVSLNCVGVVNGSELILRCVDVVLL